jgi:hypothetical protein
VERLSSGDRWCERGKEREVLCFRETVPVLAFHKKVILLALRYKEMLLTPFVVSENGY